MLRKFAILFLVFFLSLNLSAQEKGQKLIEDLILKAELLDKKNNIRIPWNGSNTNSEVYIKIDTALSNNLFINIVHPKSFALFLNGKLLYKNKAADSLDFSIGELKSISQSGQLELAHLAELLNQGNLKVRLTMTREVYDSEIIKNESRQPNKPNLEVVFLALFFVLAIVRAFSKREFDFYYSGNFLRSPRLTLEKFLGDSINPFLLFLSIFFLAFILNAFIHNFKSFDFEYRKFFGFEIDKNVFKIAIYIVLIISYLFLKRSLYLFYLWNRQETRNFSALWRTYLLSFSNLSFWYFLLCSIPILLLANLELGNYFQILFFIFAALNAIGGIMTFLNFNIKVDLLTISGILAIDVFPIILLVHFLTF